MKDMGLIKGKGKMFVCGDSRVLEGIASVMKNAYKEVKGAECEADQWWETFRRKSDKYACEVFD
jgi:sulfite reductase alpha subunit-like flavoprotein